ncbi:uncharacterized protein LOC112468124 [Temnothorax curvispinosus]|uniref:Uncharacterized protein LOC112468124 n=1 Tax=Temnothorax curvispinosus TaxID=300111 RepID=A0A6J1RF76_9HYME|nr:uncharacterized protein LOC112468124 [Temnothorax curvispinosus]
MERHDIRAEHGIFAGRFISRKRKQWCENVLIAKKKKPNEPTTVDCVHAGRRIVELGCLADTLWCNQCDEPLSLRNTESEVLKGLASELDVRCTHCNELNKVATGRSKYSDTLRNRFDVNFKLGIGKIDRLTPALVKYNGLCFFFEPLSEEVNNSCRFDGLRHNDTEEMRDWPTDWSGMVPLKASYDAGWQKRGTGHCYNSLAGHGSLIGYYSGLVLAYATRTKKCTMCEKVHEPSDHNCRLNFDRSAKAMEPDIAVEQIAKNDLLTEANVAIAVLIADDDASSIAAVRRESSHRVEKWSDLNHAKKGLTSALYHAYGKHDKCGNWCRSHTDENYVHEGLPDRKPLTDSELRANLTNIFTKYVNNASKLAPCGSSQANENFNRIVCSKHPKNQFYGVSESMAFRVAAAVCQKNLGTQYISQRSAKNASAQRREGLTYESNSGLEGVSELLWDKPDQEGTNYIIFATLHVYFFQISAATETKTFNAYMVPKSMTPGAAATTGLQVRAGEIFDAPMILRTMRKFGLLTDFMSVVRGFADTLPMFRTLLVERRKKKKKFSQTVLAQDFLGPSAIEGAHDAQNDIRILRQLINTIGIDNEAIKVAAKTTNNIVKEQEKMVVEQTNKAALQSLKPGVSAGMIAKMAKAGLSLDVLQKAYSDGNEHAVKMLLAEDIGGRPRVTKAERIIKAVVEELKRQNVT